MVEEIPSEVWEECLNNVIDDLSKFVRERTFGDDTEVIEEILKDFEESEEKTNERLDFLINAQIAHLDYETQGDIYHDLIYCSVHLAQSPYIWRDLGLI